MNVKCQPTFFLLNDDAFIHINYSYFEISNQNIEFMKNKTTKNGWQQKMQ